MARGLLFAALATTLLFTVPSTAQNNSLGCFYYDGTPAPKLTPCVDTSGGGQSTCCSQGSICWSNGICQVNYNDFAEDYLRDGCTDKTWKSPDCPPRQCTSNPSDAAGIRPCGGISVSNRYCCAGNNDGVGNYDCCTDSAEAFTLAIPTVVTTIGVGPATAKVVPISDATATSTPPESITLASTNASQTPTSASASVTPTSASQPQNQSNNTGTTVGIAVGVSVGGIFLLAFLALLFWHLRNRKKLSEKEQLLAEYQNREGQRLPSGLPNRAQSHGAHGYYSGDMKVLPVEQSQALVAQGPHEMAPERDTYELPTNSRRSQM